MPTSLMYFYALQPGSTILHWVRSIIGLPRLDLGRKLCLFRETGGPNGEAQIKLPAVKVYFIEPDGRTRVRPLLLSPKGVTRR
jgi:hypothetical protein